MNLKVSILVSVFIGFLLNAIIHVFIFPQNKNSLDPIFVSQVITRKDLKIAITNKVSIKKDIKKQLIIKKWFNKPCDAFPPRKKKNNINPYKLALKFAKTNEEIRNILGDIVCHDNPKIVINYLLNDLNINKFNKNNKIIDVINYKHRDAVQIILEYPQFYTEAVVGLKKYLKYTKKPSPRIGSYLLKNAIGFNEKFDTLKFLLSIKNPPFYYSDLPEAFCHISPSNRVDAANLLSRYLSKIADFDSFGYEVYDSTEYRIKDIYLHILIAGWMPPSCLSSES